ncbi:MAG: hypothetical protein J7K53_08015 [Bacteroidales bacterium]|nr:hypothetical protein [Bacteroidales bacterium]
MMSSFRYLKILLLVVLIPAMTWMFYNKEANWHYTRLPNGMVIVHAHPYDKHSHSHTPFPNHSHTKSELLYLDIITHFSILIITTFVLGQLIRILLTTLLLIRIRTIVLPAYRLIKDSRAPPF